MAGLKMHHIRSFIGGVVALAGVVLLAAFGAAALGIRLPILSMITDAFGL